jgi:hypothetical protein
MQHIVNNISQDPEAYARDDHTLLSYMLAIRRHNPTDEEIVTCAVKAVYRIADARKRARVANVLSFALEHYMAVDTFDDIYNSWHAIGSLASTVDKLNRQIAMFGKEKNPI